MSIVILPDVILFEIGGTEVTALPRFVPSKAARHDKLSGIEISQNVLSAAGVPGPAMKYQTFRLPSNFTRGNKDVPDISGVQLCFNTAGMNELIANIVLEINIFGDWHTLASGSILGDVEADIKEWVDIYFSNSIPINTEWIGKQFRIGVQSDTPVWYASPPVDPAESADIYTGQLSYKLLCLTADDGEDFLSNRYRSVVRRAAISNTSTVATDNTNGFWYSKPNPSKYAVESLYFDVSGPNQQETVVDRLLIDPITPGVYFNIYYSSEGDPGTIRNEWEQKLWSPVYKTYRLERRQEFALPEPVTARYMKVEFTHLQAQHYSPGTFAQPIQYEKHPKWVLDYYLARLNSEVNTEDPFVARSVRVVYDALKIGYDYYTDDLEQNPGEPNTQLDEQRLVTFLQNRTDTSDQIDQDTLNRVAVTLKPYLQQPADRIKGTEWLLSDAITDTINQNYPVESITAARADTSSVSQLNREGLVLEANYPVMQFYVPCRHTYREVEAAFENDRAYFVGVRELAFTRDHYTVAADQDVYVENLSDYDNVYRNDFIEEQFLPFDPNPAP